MTESKKSASSPTKTSPDNLTKTSAKASVALDEEQLQKVSGGTLNTGYKIGGGLKIDTAVTPDLKISTFK
jgi:hypothetical protein